jgi:hypothetical protein
MAAFMQIPHQRKMYAQRRTCHNKIYRNLSRFDEENVIWMGEHFLDDTTGETRGGALSTKQQMEVFLCHLGNPSFQVGVGEDSSRNSFSQFFTFIGRFPVRVTSAFPLKGYLGN